MITMITIFLDAYNKDFNPEDLYWGTFFMDVFLVISSMMYVGC